MGHMNEAFDIYRSLVPITSNPSAGRARALGEFGFLPFLLGQSPPLEDLLKQSLGLALQHDVPTLAGLVRAGLIAARLMRGDLDGAQIMLQDAQRYAAETSDPTVQWITLYWDAEVERALGNGAKVVDLLERALSVLRDTGDLWSASVVEAFYVRAALAQGDWRRAEDVCVDGLSERQPLHDEDRRGIVFLVEALGWVACARGLADRAARLLGAAESARDRNGTQLYFNEQEEHERTVESVRSVLGTEAWSRLRHEGQSLSLQDAVTYAMTRGGGEAPRPVELAGPTEA